MAELARPTKAPHIGLILTGLMLGILLAALDQTIVGTSLAKIVRDIGGFEHFAWLFSAYMLASVIVVPIAGKLSDLYGRRPVYIGGMLVFLLGSALCGTAGSIGELITYRAIQGLGGGAIFPVALATIADLYPPTERGRIMGLFGGVWGIASVIGPFLGGWIVDNVHIGDIASWRWVFYVNLPVGALGIFMVGTFFPRAQTQRAPRIDIAGIVTLTTALLAGLLVTVLGGETYAWASWQVFGLATLAIASLAAFIMIERRAADPILPLRLFANPIFSVSAIASILTGGVMFTVISFMPTYLQGVVGMSATYAGTALVPLSLGIVGGSVVSGVLMKRFGYKPFALLGFAIAVIGYGLLSRLGAAPSVLLAVLEMALLGVGIGFTLQTFVIAVQNSISRKDVGVGTSTLTLFRMLGALTGVTVLGVILTRHLQNGLAARLPAETIAQLLPQAQGRIGNIPSLLVDPRFLATADPLVIESIRSAFTEAMTLLFLIAAALAVVGVGVSAALKSVPMKSAAEYNAEERTPAAHPVEG